MRHAKSPILFAIILATGFATTPVTRGAVPNPAKTGRLGVVTWPAPAGEKLFEDYTVRVNRQDVPVYVCRVSAMPFNQVWPGYQRPMDQTELAGFAYWEMSGPVVVEVTARQPFKSVAVRPTSRGIKPAIKGQRITLRLAHPGQFTVELDGTHHALHLFANPPEVGAPKPGDPNVMYFGAGVHRPGKIQLQRGQTIYIAGGAVVYTAIEGRDISGMRILGRGIIDTSEFERGKGGGSIHLEDCSDVKVEGVIIRDSDLYGLSAFGSKKIEVANVKLIGFWRYNTDGIDMCNSQDVTVRDSFIRSFDDSMVLKGTLGKSGGARPLIGHSYHTRPERGLRLTGLVIWCDWGRALELGAETSAPEFADVIFRDIDVIHNTHIAMDLQHSDRAAIHDIHFEDIRVEVDDLNPLPTIQRSQDAKYQPEAEAHAEACGGCATVAPGAAYIPNLFVIVIHPTGVSRDHKAGTVRDVSFTDISVTGKMLPPSAFSGLDAEHDVRGVTIQNLRFNGKPITSAADAHLEIREYVEDVRFAEGAGKP